MVIPIPPIDYPILTDYEPQTMTMEYSSDYGQPARSLSFYIIDEESEVSLSEQGHLTEYSNDQWVEALEVLMTPAGHSTITALQDLRQLQPDWDTYGAEAISDFALSEAFMLIVQLLDHSPDESGLPGWIGPTPIGGVELSWIHGSKEVEIDVSPSGVIGLLSTVRSDQGKQFSERDDISRADAIQAVLQVLSE